MDDWQLDPHIHRPPPSPVQYQQSGDDIFPTAVCLFLFIVCVVLGMLSLNKCFQKKAKDHDDNTNYIDNKSTRNKKIFRCIIYTLETSAVVMVIFCLFRYYAFRPLYYQLSDNINLTKRHYHMHSSSLMKISHKLSHDQMIGFSVGGAKSINNFRDNIENDYLPLTTSITYEGLFYDYYFDTNTKQMMQCKYLFCPTYSSAVTNHPLSNNNDDVEYYLSVGLNSGIKADQFKRKKLNLVIVLDISGSMSSSFSKYYYDQKNIANKKEKMKDDWNKSKLEIAKESIVGLLDHLTDNDRFGMILFDGSAYIAKPLNLVGTTDIDAIKKHIIDLQTKGSTNFEAGYRAGSQLFTNLNEKILKDTEYENRIIALTDAMPNTGDFNEKSLFGLTDKNANDINGGIYSTFIGLGVDFNTDLIETITKIRGANYYAVHSYKDFMKRMDNEFEFMVTPLVFNLELKLNCTENAYEIEKVYGSPEANKATGQIMRVNTLFPSASNDNAEVKGGITLLKLKKNKDVDINTANLRLETIYEDRNNEKHTHSVSVIFNGNENNKYENTGIRKAVLLSRYAQLMKDWIDYQTNDDNINMSNGDRSKWEHQSTALQVNDKYKEQFAVFHGHFIKEMEQINDDSLQKEVDILHKLSIFEPNLMKKKDDWQLNKPSNKAVEI